MTEKKNKYDKPARAYIKKVVKQSSSPVTKNSRKAEDSKKSSSRKKSDTRKPKSPAKGSSKK